jgi:hypothetical protein
MKAPNKIWIRWNEQAPKGKEFRWMTDDELIADEDIEGCVQYVRADLCDTQGCPYKRVMSVTTGTGEGCLACYKQNEYRRNKKDMPG